MLAGDPLHLNLVRLILPSAVYVAQSPFKSQREATKEMLRYKGQHYFDWVIRDRTFWSFRDPRGTLIANVIDIDTVETIEAETLSQADEVTEENTFIDLLRRSVEAQLRDDLAFDKEIRSLYFRARAPGQVRKYEYNSMQHFTSADVVSVYEKEGRTTVMVIAHPTRVIGSTGVLAASTRRTVSSTDAPLAFAVLTTERKAA